MGKCNQEDPDTIVLKKMKKLFNESREKLHLDNQEEEIFDFDEFAEYLDSNEKLVKKLFDLIVKETYSTYRKTNPNSDNREVPSSTILFTSSPLTAMLHLVSQSQNQNSTRRNNQERTSSMLSSLVTSLQDTRRDLEPDDDEEIF
eukprot:gene9237-1323_t